MSRHYEVLAYLVAILTVADIGEMDYLKLLAVL